MSWSLASSWILATANHVWASGAGTLCIKQCSYCTHTHTSQHLLSHTLLFTGLQSHSFDQWLWLLSINDPSSSTLPAGTKRPRLSDPWLHSKPQFTPDLELMGCRLRLLTAFRVEIIHAFFFLFLDTVQSGKLDGIFGIRDVFCSCGSERCPCRPRLVERHVLKSAAPERPLFRLGLI